MTQTEVDMSLAKSGNCLFTSWMVDWRHLSWTLKHDLAVPISLRQVEDNSLLNCQTRNITGQTVMVHFKFVTTT